MGSNAGQMKAGQNCFASQVRYAAACCQSVVAAGNTPVFVRLFVQLLIGMTPDELLSIPGIVLLSFDFFCILLPYFAFLCGARVRISFATGFTTVCCAFDSVPPRNTT